MLLRSSPNGGSVVTWQSVSAQLGAKTCVCTSNNVTDAGVRQRHSRPNRRSR